MSLHIGQLIRDVDRKIYMFQNILVSFIKTGFYAVQKLTSCVCSAFREASIVKYVFE